MMLRAGLRVSGPELDAVAGQAVGLTPELRAVVSDDGGESNCAEVSPFDTFRSARDLQDWLDARQARGLLPDHRLVEIELWDRYSRDPAACARLCDAARKKGVHPLVISTEAGFQAALTSASRLPIELALRGSLMMRILFPPLKPVSTPELATALAVATHLTGLPTVGPWGAFDLAALQAAADKGGEA